MWSRQKKEYRTRKVLLLTGCFYGIGAFCLALLDASSVAAFDLTMGEGASSARGIDQATSLFGSTGIFTTLSNVMLFLVGAVSVIMVVVGGFRYVISGGNTTNVGAAKNTILYAIVGLIISMLAYAIINFVIGSFVPGSEMGGTNL